MIERVGNIRIYEPANIPYIDSIGKLRLSYLVFKEGRECFEKANSEKYCACDLEDTV